MSRAHLAAQPGWWRVRDVMTAPAVHVVPTTTREEIADLLVEHGVSGLPVVDDEGRPVGVVTEADLVRGIADPAAGRSAPGAGAPPPGEATSGSGETAASLMTRPAVTATPDDDLPSTARRLLAAGCRRLPVVADDGRLVGIVSRRDLLAPASEDQAGTPTHG